MYNLTLQDGTSFNNLDANGSYFIAPVGLDISKLSGIIRNITIADLDTSEEHSPESIHENGLHKFMKVTHTMTRNNQFWFALMDIPEDKIILMELQSDVDYIAMMSDVAL